MLLSGQARDYGAGDLNQEQTPLLPPKTRWRKSRCNAGWKGAPSMCSDAGCSETCPAEFWNLPGTKSAQQFMWESFSCYKVGTSLLSIYGLSSCHALLKSLLALLGDFHIYVGTSSSGWASPAPPASLRAGALALSLLRPYAQLTAVYLLINTCWGGPKLNRVSGCSQMNGKRSGMSL